MGVAMTTSRKPVELERVPCAMCLKEVPVTEATVSEAADYFLHFCGLACYEEWKKQAPDQRARAPASGPSA